MHANVNNPVKLMVLADFGDRVTSQNGEDGILLAILDEVGARSRRCVELCAGTGVQSNTANLIRNHGFSGVLFDGNEEAVRVCARFFAGQPRATPVCAWITRENVAELIQKHVPDPDVDVLSLDMDGVDFWILRQVLRSGALRPRVMVVEYQDIIGWEAALTVPYSPTFNGWVTDSVGGPNYCGASLAAFVHLLRHDYAFVGSEACGFNAFFVLRSELPDTQTNPTKNNIKEVHDLASVFASPKVREGHTSRWPRVQHLHWVDVTKLADDQVVLCE